MSLQVVTIEDDARYRSSLARVLEVSEGLSLAASFDRVEAALAALARGQRLGRPCRWDLVLMDLELPGMSGIEGTRRLKERLPAARVVVLTVFEEPRTVLQAICAGADGYLLKSASLEEILEQIPTAADGGAPLTSRVAGTVLELVRHPPPGRPAADDRSPTRLDLTDREQEVLRALVRGRAYKQVGDELGISLGTVRAHVTSVYRKLRVHSVAEAVTRAIREGLV